MTSACHHLHTAATAFCLLPSPAHLRPALLSIYGSVLLSEPFLPCLLVCRAGFKRAFRILPGFRRACHFTTHAYTRTLHHTRRQRVHASFCATACLLRDVPAVRTCYLAVLWITPPHTHTRLRQPAHLGFCGLLFYCMRRVLRFSAAHSVLLRMLIRFHTPRVRYGVPAPGSFLDSRFLPPRAAAPPLPRTFCACRLARSLHCAPACHRRLRAATAVSVVFFSCASSATLLAYACCAPYARGFAYRLLVHATTSRTLAPRSAGATPCLPFLLPA